ncbi:MAG TPA: alanine racemase [Desulfonatronum sp.]|nr:alanine racemase [Desulfonatronum sp.]
MTIDYNLLRVSIDLRAIQENYRLLCSKGTRLIPVVKADAYGHGLVDVARALASCGADFFAVGTVEEASNLRLAVPGTVLALLGPQLREDFQAVAEQDILPLVARMDQLWLLQEQAVSKNVRLPVALKFDTGMARLGFAPSETSPVMEALQRCDRLDPQWLISHLATADDPDQAVFVREQAGRFEHILAEFHRAGFALRASLLNSAGILAYPDLGWDGQRPGIALYGVNPFGDTARESLGRGLQPAMQVRAPVVAVHPLAKGASISYGRTYTAKQDGIVAIVAAGYADNYSRGLSNKGLMLVRGKRAPILGRVCMQMTAVDVSAVPGVAPGDQAFLLGGEGTSAIRPEELAAWWGTLPYEAFCLLGMNRKDFQGR